MSELSFSKKAKSLKLGIYEHYKKKRYQVLGVALHSETLEELVIYKALYGKGIVWVRPINMFLEDIDIGGKKQPRFRFIKKM
jgi:hypothetical protein